MQIIMLNIFVSQLKGYRMLSILVPFLTFTAVILDTLLPYYCSLLIDKGLLIHNLQQIYSYGVVMLLLAVFSLFLGELSVRLAIHVSMRFAFNLRNALFEKILALPNTELDRCTRSSLITRITTDISTIQSTFQQLISSLIHAPLAFLFNTIMCIVISPRLSLIFLIALFILIILFVFVVKKISYMFSKAMKRYDTFNKRIMECLSAIPLVKAFVTEQHEYSKFKSVSLELAHIFTKIGKYVGLIVPLISFVLYFSIITMSWYGTHLIAVNLLTTGQLTSLFTYIIMSISSLMMLSSISIAISNSKPCMKRVAEVFDDYSLSTHEQTTTSPPCYSGDIEFKNISFGYVEGNETLHNICFKICSGETVGIVGPAGSGKSTILKLLTGLYTPSKGEIYIGGHDIKSYRLEEIRSIMGIAFQSSQLFTGTIIDNLKWGNESASMRDIENACKISCASDFIKKMSQAFDSSVVQGGRNLSGGQCQRLCIARALLRNPRIFILDDAISQCDILTAKKIMENLISIKEHMTKIIISQRSSVISKCSKIIILDDGNIVEIGTHSQLFQSNKYYRNLLSST